MGLSHKDSEKQFKDDSIVREYDWRQTWWGRRLDLRPSACRHQLKKLTVSVNLIIKLMASFEIHTLTNPSKSLSSLSESANNSSRLCWWAVPDRFATFKYPYLFHKKRTTKNFDNLLSRWNFYFPSRHISYWFLPTVSVEGRCWLFSDVVSR